MCAYEEMINTLIKIKKRMKESDKKKIWEYYLPNMAAEEKDIKLIGEQLGIELNDEIKEFWMQANGWNCFYQMVDLFGTEDMLSEKMDYAKKLLSVNLIYQDEFTMEQLLPIALSRDDMDIFAVVISKNKDYGKVIWYAGGEIERFSSFKIFLNAMIGYCEDDMKDFFDFITS